jgi:hypothetical protein
MPNCIVTDEDEDEDAESSSLTSNLVQESRLAGPKPTGWSESDEKECEIGNDRG